MNCNNAEASNLMGPTAFIYRLHVTRGKNIKLSDGKYTNLSSIFNSDIIVNTFTNFVWNIYVLVCYAVLRVQL